MADNSGSQPLSPRKRAVTEHFSSGGEEIQRRTFTRWVNANLRIRGGDGSKDELVQDLYEDLRDGRKIVRLLNALTKKELKIERGNMRLHHILNVSRALKCLKDDYNVDFLQYNISAEDLVDGSPRLTLGFVWRLILCFQVQMSAADDEEEAPQGSGKKGKLVRQKTVDVDAKRALLEWCAAAAQAGHGVPVRDFRGSWQSGAAFLAIIKCFRPDLVPEWPSQKSASDIAHMAFKHADDEFGVYALLDEGDLASGHTDEQSMVTYLAMLRQKLGPLPEGIQDYGQDNEVTVMTPIEEGDDAMLGEELNKDTTDTDGVNRTDEEQIEAVMVVEESAAVAAEPVLFAEPELPALPAAEEEEENDVTGDVADDEPVPEPEPEPEVREPVVEEMCMAVPVETTATEFNLVDMDDQQKEDTAPEGGVEQPSLEADKQDSGNQQQPDGRLSDADVVRAEPPQRVQRVPRPLSYIWWPWLGLLPLVASLAYEAGKWYGS